MLTPTHNNFLQPSLPTVSKIHSYVNPSAVRSRKYGPRLGKSLLDNAPGEFTRLLSVKSQWAGRSFYKVSEADTTITCSTCDARTGPGGLRGLSVRSWVCARCQTVHDRDVCGAQNTERVPPAGKLSDVTNPDAWSSQGRVGKTTQIQSAKTGSLASVSRNDLGGTGEI